MILLARRRCVRSPLIMNAMGALIRRVGGPLRSVSNTIHLLLSEPPDQPTVAEAGEPMILFLAAAQRSPRPPPAHFLHLEGNESAAGTQMSAYNHMRCTLT